MADLTTSERTELLLALQDRIEVLRARIGTIADDAAGDERDQKRIATCERLIERFLAPDGGRRAKRAAPRAHAQGEG